MMQASGTGAQRARNAMTIDVEDYFQVSAMAPYIARESWGSLPCRAERNVERLIERLDAHDTKATFFTLGWIAERFPGIPRMIVGAGHELASHGYGHERVSELTPEALREDLVRAKHMLEDIGGVEVIGYRAPSFSIGRDNLWALDTLLETGHRYSSSIYPIAHDHYGMAEASRFAFRTDRGLLEIPASSVRIGGRNLPASGGGYFRLLPYPVSRWCIERVNEQDGESVVFYCHPWEFDPTQPRVPGIDLKTRFRHYVNLSTMMGKLERLLTDFSWAPMREVFLARLEQAR